MNQVGTPAADKRGRVTLPIPTSNEQIRKKKPTLKFPARSAIAPSVTARKGCDVAAEATGGAAFAPDLGLFFFLDIASPVVPSPRH